MQPQGEETLPYELLLRKSREVDIDTAASGKASEQPVEETLPYELLLRKSREVDIDTAASGKASEQPVEDSSSTAAPVSSAASMHSVAEPTRHETQFLRNVNIHPPFEDERVAGLIRQTRRLSHEAFNEDCLQEVTKKSGWKLSLLVSEDLILLCGFVVAKVFNGTLSIAKIAVPMALRGKGFGRSMMDALIRGVRKQGDVYEVALSSLPSAVIFYQHLGFKAFKGMKLSSEEDVVEGQVYMEKKLRGRPRRMR